MKFKVVYREGEKDFKVNCLTGAQREELPDNNDGFVRYPVPNELLEEIREFMDSKFKKFTHLKDEIKKIEELERQIFHLHHEKRNLINEVRRKMNPKIITLCKEFSIEHPEHFI